MKVAHHDVKRTRKRDRLHIMCIVTYLAILNEQLHYLKRKVSPTRRSIPLRVAALLNPVKKCKFTDMAQKIIHPHMRCPKLPNTFIYSYIHTCSCITMFVCWRVVAWEFAIIYIIFPSCFSFLFSPCSPSPSLLYSFFSVLSHIS